MLTLSNCANDEHNAWWDIEAEIQKELEALDAHDSTCASGNSQIEVVEEKEKVNVVDQVADDFENLMERFHLQNEKFLQFEQCIFSSGRCPNALLEDTEVETFSPGEDLNYAHHNYSSPREDLDYAHSYSSRGEDLEYAHSYSSHSCFLTVQPLIRPLYCLDQEGNLCFNGERDADKNVYPCIRNKDSIKDLEEDHEIGFMKEVQRGQTIVKDMEKVKRLSMHAAKRTQKGQRISILENAKDALLHSLYLNHKLSSLDEVKPKYSDAKCTFLLDIALMLDRNKDKEVVSTRWNSGAASINSCQPSFLQMRANHALTQTTGRKHQQSIDETKTALADIAKDWGFKEEKTALQFIRALNNTRRRAEGPKAPKPDSQTRFRAFMARTGRHKELSPSD